MPQPVAPLADRHGVALALRLGPLEAAHVRGLGLLEFFLLELRQQLLELVLVHREVLLVHLHLGLLAPGARLGE